MNLLSMGNDKAGILTNEKAVQKGAPVPDNVLDGYEQPILVEYSKHRSDTLFKYAFAPRKRSRSHKTV